MRTLKDQDPRVRAGAVAALGGFDVPSVCRASLRRSRTRRGRCGRKRRARSAPREEKSTVAELASALKDVDGRVRQTAAWALGQLESPNSIAPLSAALHDEEQQVRIRAAWALGQIRERRLRAGVWLAR